MQRARDRELSEFNVYTGSNYMAKGVRERKRERNIEREIEQARDRHMVREKRFYISFFFERKKEKERVRGKENNREKRKDPKFLLFLCNLCLGLGKEKRVRVIEKGNDIKNKYKDIPVFSLASQSGTQPWRSRGPPWRSSAGDRPWWT